MPTNKKLVEDDRLTQADSTNADERPCDRYEEERESCDQGEAFPDNVADECRVPYAEEAAEPSEPPHDGEAADPSDAASAADCADAANNHTPNMHNKDLGKRGEDAAAAFLERRGFDVLHRNWVCAAGEADIIALDDDALHFVEVKTRMSDRNGFPAEAVDANKRKRYERIAEIYLAAYEGPDTAVTFDIISILVTGEHRAFLRMHRNVFANDCE